MNTESKTIKQIQDEEEIIANAKRDPKAFGLLYERYFRTMFVFILHRIGDKDLTADICSQVFLKAMMNISRYKSKGLPFSAWLYRIAINECNDFFRKVKRTRMVVLEDATAENLFEEMFMHEAKDELLSQLPRVLQRLKGEELQVVELRFFESRSFKEVAHILGITENYAKVKVYRTLDKIKKLMINH